MPKISLSGPADLLAAIPYHLGFRPERSVVVVCFHGKRLGLMARVDAVGPEHAALAASQLLPALLREAPSSVAVVGFEQTPGQSMPLSDALAVGVALERIPLRERLTVRDGRWFGIGCDCCPVEGTAMPADADVPALATFVGLGQAVLGDRDAVTRLVEPLASSAPLHDFLACEIDTWQESYAWSLLVGAGDGLDAILRQYDSLDAASGDEGDGEFAGEFAGECAGDCGDACADGLHTLDAYDEDLNRVPQTADLVEASFEAWGSLLHSEVSDERLQLLMPDLVSPLRFPELRDALIAWICPGTLSLELVAADLLESLELHLGPEVRQGSWALDEVADLESDLEPDFDSKAAWEAALLPRAIEARLERLCRATPSVHAAPVLSVFASYAWWAGDGAKAGMAVDRALALEGDHRLCGLIRNALNHGLRSQSAA